MPAWEPDDVRERCAGVARRSRYVTLEADVLDDWVSGLPLHEVAHPPVDSSCTYRGDEASTVAWVLTFDAVNFGSGWFPHVRKLPGGSGSITMMTRLTERFRAVGPLAAEELTAMTPERCGALFDQPLDPPVDELLALFAHALRELGRFLLEHHDGRFQGPVEEAGGSARRLTRLLQAMPLFRDVAVHDGTEVPLLKRAQIVASDLDLLLGGEGLGRFTDLDCLTMFADNLVPHVLRLDGVLRIDDDLAGRIERGDLLVPGSPEEVELRAVAVHAVEEAVRLLRAQGHHEATARGIDQVVWARGQGPRYKAVPRPRARTTSY